MTLIISKLGCCTTLGYIEHMHAKFSLVPGPSSPSSNIWEAEKKEETLYVWIIIEEYQREKWERKVWNEAMHNAKWR